jgi:hypothetical protein
MAVAGTLDLQWRFGRMFLDYMNPAWPKGALVFVADVPLNPNNAPVECEFVADVPTMQELMAAPVDPNLTLGQNVLAYCEDLMRRKGGLPGVAVVEAPTPSPAPSPAPAPAPAPEADPPAP